MKTLVTIITLFIMYPFASTMDQSAPTTFSTEIIRYSIPEQDRQHFETAYAEAGKYLQASPYCLSYQVLHGNEEPQHYIVVIHWTSQTDHLQGFRKSQQFPPFFNLVKPFYNNIEEMKHYDLTPTQWIRK
ncbi:antibiotic biosynthesis monooxygenase [Chitinophaga sp. HK235]|uniref:antibiotic biosynthesis monooxygenase family protein n=1 Tax=Chitinophaga sp. HK235 TaxID=2952571 RepID=UPI001BAE00A3|nr:antibiotic biosynthesis monooxygenase family protein [Chitinophaga sp. HK235]